MERKEEQYAYVPPPLARFFHALPHLNVSLHLVNNTFAPDSDVYLEALGILGSLPAAWLILTLLVLLVYLLTRCCDRKPRPRHSITVLKWTLALFTLLCCGAVGVALYGNDDVHNGLLQFVEATANIDDLISSVKNRTAAIENLLETKVEPLLTELSDVFDGPVANQTARALLLSTMAYINGNSSTALANMQEISRPLHGISLSPVVSIVQEAETIRWPVTMAILSVLLVFCMVLLFGVARHSRCALITFSVFGLFAVIISWIMASIYLASSVALGDLCVAPEAFLEREAPGTTQAEILTYYVRCEGSRANPFSQRLQAGQRAVQAMGAGLSLVGRIARELYDAGKLHPLDMLITERAHVEGLVTGLTAMVDCRRLHQQYVSAANSLCDLGLYGLTFMLVASISAGFFFTVLVWVDSHTWIYIRKRRDYLQVDEQDPFLPPSAASQAIAARTLRSQGSYGSTGYFRPRNSPHHYYSPHVLDGRSSREEKSQHGSHHEPAGGGGHEHGSGASAMLGPNHGQYATLSKQCKTLESSDFY
ncbi:protein tweety isoform X1 [Schistocerca cancellata]|uniref:protein tweety isoform X1 n=1 Tax=Schistocerca cancellata TaxID=274614 RepID=UPI002118C448|nr:protein tweety isoform X1 [Schistocerca cancellata]XP_049775889.1 protein tweety isoform X1 [Schistocerca cancellata]